MSAGVNIASRLSQPRALNAPAPRPDTVSGRSRHHRRMGIGVVMRRMHAGLEVFRDGAAFSGGPGGVVGDHAGGLPVAGEHGFGGGGAPGGELTGQADAATVGGEAALGLYSVDLRRITTERRSCAFGPCA